MMIAAVRFIVFMAVFAAAVLWWAISAHSHAAMGIVGMGIFLSGAAAPAWCAALMLRRVVTEPVLRLLFHVASVVAVFAGLASLATIVLIGPEATDQLDLLLRYSAVVALAAAADAAVAFWHDRRQIAAHG